MSLTEWLNQGKLVRQRSSPREIADIFSVVERDLADSQVPGLSNDSQLISAYKAALQLAKAALAASGYRTRGQFHHSTTIESLAYTIGAEDELIAQLDGFRSKRNISDYDRAGTVSTQEVKEMFNLAEMLRDMVTEWLEENHPNLIGK